MGLINDWVVAGEAFSKKIVGADVIGEHEGKEWEGDDRDKV